MFGKSQNTKKLDNFYINICRDINEWLIDHKLSEYENVFIMKNKQPIIGLHSTTLESYTEIIDNGFNNRHEKAKILGETLNWPEALFASPFLKNGNIIGKRDPNNYITFTNGFNRIIKHKIFSFFDKWGINIPKLKNEYPDEIISFPMIISAFKNDSDKEIKFNGNWIECYDPNKQCIILGVIYINFTFDEIIEIYHKYINGTFDIYVLNNEINYEINWDPNIKQEYVTIDF
jgi:hypothetical protein